MRAPKLGGGLEVATSWSVQDVLRFDGLAAKSEENKNHAFCFPRHGRDRSPIHDINVGR